MGIINAAGMDETGATYVEDKCFDIHDCDDDTDHVTDDDTGDDTDDYTDNDSNDDTDDGTDDGGRGNLYTIKIPSCCCWVSVPWSLVLWSLILGSWSVVLGLRPLVLGPWSSLFGPWSLVLGFRSLWIYLSMENSIEFHEILWNSIEFLPRGMS